MTSLFKNATVEKRWHDLDYRVKAIFCTVADTYASGPVSLVITDTIRTAEEDAELKASGVHQTTRALDFVAKVDPYWKGTLTAEEEMRAIANELNETFPRKGKYKTATYHEGTAWHVHLQVSGVEDTIMKVGYDVIVLRKP